MKAWCSALAVVLAAALLSACGYVGPPQPPTLDIPVTITDFRAWEYGDNIEIEFTLPDKTTENLPLTSVRSIELRIGENPADSKLVPLPIAKPGPVTGQVPRCKHGSARPSSWPCAPPAPKESRRPGRIPRSLSVIQPLAPPSTPKRAECRARRGADVDRDGPALSHLPRRSRRPAAAARRFRRPSVPGRIDQSTATRYRYLVQAIAAREPVERGFRSRPRSLRWIRFRRRFPKVCPRFPLRSRSSLPGRATRNRIFAATTSSAPSDDGPFEKIATLIDAPTFSDSKIEAGKKYRYTVSAVDLTGNESAQIGARGG